MFVLVPLFTLGGCATSIPGPAHSKQFDAFALSPPIDLLEETRIRTVKVVHTQLADPRGLGTGVVFIHRDAAYVLTATHVVTSNVPTATFGLAVPNKPGLAIEFFDGSRLPVTRLMTIGDTDLTIIGPISIPSRISGIRFIDLGAASNALPGEPLLIWGSPHGYGPSPFMGTLAYRVIYKIDISAGRSIRLELVPESISMDDALAMANVKNALLGFESAAGVAPGVSGGPAFDREGRLFGLVGFSTAHTGDPATRRAMGIVSRSALSRLLVGIDLLRAPPR